MGYGGTSWADTSNCANQKAFKLAHLSLILSNLIEHVLPITAVIAVGWFLGRMKLFSYEQARGINRFTLYAGIPALLVSLMGRAEFATVDIRLNLLHLALLVGGYILVFCIARYVLGREVKQALLLGFCASYANQFFLTLPILKSAVGAAAVPIAVMTVILDVFVLYGMTMFALGYLDKRSLKGAALRFVRDPVVVFSALALAINLSGVGLPGPVLKFTDFLGAAASPMALFVLGIIMAEPRQGSVKLAGFITLYKLAVVPFALMGLIALLPGTNPQAVNIVLVTSVAPLGLTPFVVGLNEGVRVETIGLAILFTTFISTIMMPFFL